MAKELLTDAAFEALCTLIRVREGKTKKAARLVLVDGLSGVAAASQTGLLPTSVNNTVVRIRGALWLAKIATGLG